MNSSNCQLSSCLINCLSYAVAYLTKCKRCKLQNLYVSTKSGFSTFVMISTSIYMYAVLTLTPLGYKVKSGCYIFY